MSKKSILDKRKILYIQCTNPCGYPPLEHSSHILANEGWKVLFLGLDVRGTNGFAFPEHPNIKVYKNSFCEAGWQQKFQYCCYCLWVLTWIIRWRPKWIYASDILVCPIAYILTFIPKLEVIYHEHDSLSSEKHSFFVRLCLKFRAYLTRRTKLCILPNQDRVKKFTLQASAPESKILCVWNCPRKEEARIKRKNIYQVDQNDIWILYHGSIVPDRLPKAAVKAISYLPENLKLRIIGYETVGHRNYIKELHRIASNLDLLNRVQFIDLLPRHQLLSWGRKSDIGLALMPMQSTDINLNSMAGASNKPFDYLACGLPIIVTDLPDWRKMYVETGYGLACNPESPQSIAGAIELYVNNPSKMRKMGEHGRHKILQDWNYETQFEPVSCKLM